MRVSIDEIHKVKEPETFIYKVYCVHSKNHYNGSAYVAAENAEKANEIIRKYKENDPNNKSDSWGWSEVKENNYIDELSDIHGILDNDIRYYG